MKKLILASICLFTSTLGIAGSNMPPLTDMVMKVEIDTPTRSDIKLLPVSDKKIDDLPPLPNIPPPPVNYSKTKVNKPNTNTDIIPMPPVYRLPQPIQKPVPREYVLDVTFINRPEYIKSSFFSNDFPFTRSFKGETYTNGQLDFQYDISSDSKELHIFVSSTSYDVNTQKPSGHSAAYTIALPITSCSSTLNSSLLKLTVLSKKPNCIR